MGFRTKENRDKFDAFVHRLRVEGKCQCFDCLRAAGFTPPKAKRRNHPALSPHQIYGKDEGGEPVLTEGKGAKHGGTDADQVGTTAAERSHLKHAIANRDVI